MPSAIRKVVAGAHVLVFVMPHQVSQPCARTTALKRSHAKHAIGREVCSAK